MTPPIYGIEYESLYHCGHFEPCLMVFGPILHAWW